jgi:hypothetical protein
MFIKKLIKRFILIYQISLNEKRKEERMKNKKKHQNKIHSITRFY